MARLLNPTNIPFSLFADWSNFTKGNKISNDEAIKLINLFYELENNYNCVVCSGTKEENQVRKSKLLRNGFNKIVSEDKLSNIDPEKNVDTLLNLRF